MAWRNGGDGDYTSVATSLHSKSLGYGKFAPGSSSRASPALKLLGGEPRSFRSAETVGRKGERGPVHRRSQGRRFGGGGVTCRFAPPSSLLGQDGDGRLRGRNRERERFAVTRPSFLHGFLFLPPAVPA